MSKPIEQLHSDFGALSQRVINFEQSLSEFKASTSQAISNISSQIQSLASTMEGRLRPHWGNMAAMVTAGTALFVYFVISPIQETIKNQNNAITSLQREIGDSFKDLRERTVSWREHEQLLHDLREQRASQVSRSEHEQRWKRDEAARETIQHDINQLQDRINSQYNTGDLIKELQRRIHELELRVPQK